MNQAINAREFRARSRGNDFAPLMREVALRLCGTPSSETRDELRFGSRGSLAVDLVQGVFFDNEANVGGGVLYLIEHKTGAKDGARIAWLRAEGFKLPELQEAPKARREPVADRRPSRVPTNYIGKLLDHGKPSATAIKLLAIKYALGGPGFVVNEHRAAAHGMGWREYHSGLNLLTAAGIIHRWQEGRRSFSKERLVTAAGHNYVEIDAALLALPAKVVAFILAANLSPNATRPAELCRRFGISSDVTIRKITEAAIATGAVAVWRPRKGPHLVARPGTVFNRVEDGHPVKNGAAKNGATLNSRETPSESERDSSPPSKSHSLKGSATEPHGGGLAEELVEELRTADIAGALAAHLLSPNGIEGYLALIRRHGATARSAVLAKLAAFAIDGVDPGQIWTWAYFNDPIADEVKLNSMVERGERPGDVFGFHRKIKLEG